MRKIAIFGKPGSGKSTLSKALAAATNIPLYPLDVLRFKKNGDVVDRDTYINLHDSIVLGDLWVIDGFDLIETFNTRLEAADTLVYIDLPYYVSYWLVTKRLLKGLIKKPDDWPEGSSVFKGTIESYKILRFCPKFWNDDFLQKLEAKAIDKKLYIIRTMTQLNNFVAKNA